MPIFPCTDYTSSLITGSPLGLLLILSEIMELALTLLLFPLFDSVLPIPSFPFPRSPSCLLLQLPLQKPFLCTSLSSSPFSCICFPTFFCLEAFMDTEILRMCLSYLDKQGIKSGAYISSYQNILFGLIIY